MVGNRYKPPQSLEYNEFVGELRPANDRTFTELHVRYGVRKNLYLDWSITLRARFGGIDEFIAAKASLERRMLVVVEVADSAIVRRVFNPDEPDEPPTSIVLMRLYPGDGAKVDELYDVQIDALREMWMQGHGPQAVNDRHNEAIFNFASQDRDPEFRNGDFSWVRNTLVSLSTDLVDSIIGERGGFYFPDVGRTVGVLGSSGRMQFIAMNPSGTVPADKADLSSSRPSSDVRIMSGANLTMGSLLDRIYPGPMPDDWANWPAPWDGVSAKLDHAWRHFDALAKYTLEFVQQNPFIFETVAAPERGANWLKCELHVTHPGKTISLMFGDFLHNVRCALDHTLTAIDPKAGRKVNFPTCLTEAEFDGWAPKWTEAGGSPGALAEVRRHQPFHAVDGLNPEDYVLRIIARLSNTDKHRLLHLTPVGVSDEMPPTLEIQSTVGIASCEYLVQHGRPLEHRQTALLIELDGPIKHASVQVTGTIPIAVSIDNYFDLVGLAARLHGAVTDTCRDLRQGSLNGWMNQTAAEQSSSRFIMLDSEN